MNKLIKILLGALMVLALAACSNKEEPKDEGAKNEAENPSGTVEGKNNASESSSANGSNSSSENNDGKVPVYQKYDFPPSADLSAYSDEFKNQLQEIVNSYGDVKKDTIEFKDFNSYFTEDGSFVMEGFVRNGTPHTIFNINGVIEVKTLEGEIFASGSFAFTPDVFGSLPPTMSRLWAITFTPDAVFNKNVDISKYQIFTNLKYNY